MTDKTNPALLSKLRAPVADERQGDIAAALQDSAYCAGLQRGFVLGNHNDNDGLRRALESRDGYVKTIKDARAALASAPVAGEAVTDEMIQAGAKAAREYFERTGGNDPAVIYRAMRATAPAAPQASEAD
ncbi:hypothetical protein E2544_08605 [Achromobacter insolitus]|uniref:hypothetical protein n=1 Tax=Achromobacter insolitus TaxID=217204 RepID=UPI0011EA9F0C|nr:hypothetical protein [Achromobacter insolitus]QEK91869.1 hypothetical protein E2544_08605 [Achromobacter insolitus]